MILVSFLFQKFAGRTYGMMVRISEPRHWPPSPTGRFRRCRLSGTVRAASTSLTVHRERMSVSTQQKVIAVLDDDPSALSAAGSLLTALDFKAILFASPADFLNSDAASTIDCLLLDIHLGTTSGIDMRRELTISHSMLPVIFITGLDDEDAYWQALEVGCAGFLRKPFQAQLLADAIRSATGD